MSSPEARAPLTPSCREPHRHGRIGAGVLALVFFALHAGRLAAAGDLAELVWMCHLACLLVALGLLLRRATLNALGLLWLCMGVPLWLLNVLSSADQFLATSALTHLGGLALGCVGVRLLGMPTGVWWKAFAGYLILRQISRWVTPPALNVNLAFRVWPGFEDRFPSYAVYMLVVLSVGLLVFVLGEQLGRRFARRA